MCVCVCDHGHDCLWHGGRDDEFMVLVYFGYRHESNRNYFILFTILTKLMVSITVRRCVENDQNIINRESIKTFYFSEDWKGNLPTEHNVLCLQASWHSHSHTIYHN